MRVYALDHLMVTVRNPDATTAFCERGLHMQAATFGDRRGRLSFGKQKINLHPVVARESRSPL